MTLSFHISCVRTMLSTSIRLSRIAFASDRTYVTHSRTHGYYGNFLSLLERQPFCFAFILALFNYFDPSFRSLDASHLDAGEGVVQFLCDWSHFFHTAGQADFFAVIHDLAHRRDDCGGAA